MVYLTAPGGSAEPISRQDSEAPVEEGEDGEAMEATNDDDAAMMAMMGLSGFGSTKVCWKRRWTVYILTQVSSPRANISRATKKAQQM